MRNHLKSLIQNVAFATALTVAATLAHAHEHQPERITGAGIELMERDHAFAGQILERPVFGAFEHNPFGGQVQFRVGEQTLTLRLENTNQVHGGSISEQRRDSKTGGVTTLTTSVSLLKVERTGAASARITLLIDQQQTAVEVSAPEFKLGHFHGPQFKASVNGQPVEFQFSGEACMGYSSHLAMMILGTYAHLLK